jgi:hypothetical protein
VYFACCNVLRGEKGRRFAPVAVRRIFNSVSRDYPVARRLGHTLVA